MCNQKMSLTKLYLIRHGQSIGNAEGRFGGHTQTPLSLLGQTQADLTAHALKKERITAIYSSDLRRAVQTAEPLANLVSLDVETTPAFRERSVGVLEGLTFNEAEKKFPADYNALVYRNIRHIITNGESYTQLLERTTTALGQILEKHRGGRIAIFAHTGTICFTTLQILGAINEKTTHTPWLITSNCGINRFEFRPNNNIRVMSINDTRHLSEISGNDAFAAR
jgi:2,3-bisphosphoglycerate-dependent phosphoglycerate mutase